jgi:amino acid transporter
VINTVTAVVVPEGYKNWVDYINDLPGQTGLLSLPTFHAAYQLLGKPGLFFIGVAVVAASLSGIVGFYMAASRLLYSMSKEGVLPRWFGTLHPKYKTPANAILFVLLISLAAPFFGRTALGWIVDMSSIGAAIGYGYTSASAFVFAKKEGKRGIMVTGILGTLMAVMFAVLLLVPIPFFNCSLGKESYTCLLAWIVLGLVFYVKTRSLRESSVEEAEA